MSRRKPLTPEEASSLRQLMRELLAAYNEGLSALVTHGKPVEGVALKRLQAAEAKQVRIVQQIKDIQGPASAPWMA